MSRVYRALLRLYPASFRAEYGADLEAVFDAGRRRAPGVAGAAATWAAAVADVVPNAAAAHWDVLGQDLRYVARGLRRSPGFALTAVLVVALGVGANTAAFSVADFVLLRPPPFPRPDRLARLWETTPGYPRMEASPPNYRDWKASLTSFSAVGGYVSNAVNFVAGGGEPRRIGVTLVTAEVLPILEVPPAAGRLFVPSDTVAASTVILSYDFWQTEFGGDRRTVGSRIELDGTPYTVVGVMPRDFHFPDRATAVWVPLQFTTARGDDDRTNNYLSVIGRLADGVTRERAAAELVGIASRLQRAYPAEDRSTGARVVAMDDDVSPRTRLLLLALCGAALCTLLLACANLASLLLARGVARQRELAVRAALGAGRERLVRQMATESLVLAVAGGIVGIGAAAATLPALALLAPANRPIGGSPSIDPRVLAFASLMIALTGLAVGVAPAVRAGGARAIDALRDGVRSGGGRKQRLRAALVVVEVMASVTLLASSGLLVRAMWRLQSVDPGFTTSGVLTLRTPLPMPQYGATGVRARFYTSVLSQVRALPGVEAAGYISWLPMGSLRGGIWPVIIRGRTVIRDASHSASMRYVTPGFFATLRIPVLVGRDVAETDDTTRPYVAVVSESFARRYWPGEDPIGKHFDIGLSDRMVVGVVRDVRVRGLEQPSEPQAYLPARQVPDSALIFYSPQDLAIRSTRPTPALIADVRRIVHSVDPRLPISNVMTMDAVVAGETASRAAQLRVLGALAAIALLLAGVGLHGLLSFTVSRRSQEIGVRVALGAQSATIARMVLREGLALAVGGLIPGVALAYAAGRAMQAVLAGVAPGDPPTFAVAAVTCLVMAVAGCLRPAVRAASVDPATALRAE